jgi:hypothetical protein
MLAGMSSEEREARKYGKFVAASGLVYPSFNPAIHCISPIEPGAVVHQIITGMDHGLRNPTAWLWAYVDNEGRIIVFHEYYEPERTITEHASEINFWERTRNIQFKVGYRVGDPSIAQRNAVNGESVQSEYSRDDVFIGLGNNDLPYGLNRVRRLLDTRGLLITNDCVHLIRELHTYRWSQFNSMKAREAKQPREMPEKKNDHAVDALRYLVCSRPENEWGGQDIPHFAPRTPSHTVPRDDGYTEHEFLGDVDERYHPVLGDDW